MSRERMCSLIELFEIPETLEERNRAPLIIEIPRIDKRGCLCLIREHTRRQIT